MIDQDSNRRLGRLACMVGVIAVVAFLPTVTGGYVYDDHRFIESNGSLGFPEILWRAFSDPSVQTGDGTHAGLWRPLRTLSFALDRAAFGDATWAARAVSLLIHGWGAFLLTMLFGSFSANARAAAVGALVVSVHPVQAECVAWLSSRGDLMAYALVLGALLADLRGRGTLALVLGAAALLSKEQAVVWPALVLITLLASGREWPSVRRRAVAAAIVTAAFVVVRHLMLDEPFQEGGLPTGTPESGELFGMLGHQFAVTWLPVRPVFDWQMPWPPRGATRLLVAAAALLPVIALFRKETRGPALWFLVALVPTLFVQLVVPLNIRVADRFILFALPALGWVVARALDRRPSLLAPVALAAGMLLVLAVSAGAAFRSDTSLWTRTAAAAPGHWRAAHWLGLTALRDGRTAEALPHLELAVKASPQDAKTRFHHAQALEAAAVDAEPAGSGLLFRRARDEYLASATLYAAGDRQENRAGLQPLAQLLAAYLTLIMEDRPRARDTLESWLRQPTPQLPVNERPLWDARLDTLIKLVRAHLDPDLAARLREWADR